MLEELIEKLAQYNQMASRRLSLSSSSDVSKVLNGSDFFILHKDMGEEDGDKSMSHYYLSETNKGHKASGQNNSSDDSRSIKTESISDSDE